MPSWARCASPFCCCGVPQMDGLLMVYWMFIGWFGGIHILHIFTPAFVEGYLWCVFDTFICGWGTWNIGFVTKSPGSRSEISAPWLRHPARWNARVFSRRKKVADTSDVDPTAPAQVLRSAWSEARQTWAKKRGRYTTYHNIIKWLKWGITQKWGSS